MSIKYVFSINSGRSGSDYLTASFSCATNSVSVHEGFPIMNSMPMIQFNEGDESKLRDLMPLKLQQIRKSIGKHNKIYCETNHSYIKGWGYLLPDEYIPQEESAVVVLRRDIEESAYSLLRVHDVPGSSHATCAWYLPLYSKRNLSTPPENAGPYDICQWYIRETNLRAEQYKIDFPKITYIECDLKDLNDYNYVLKMFEQLGLNPTAQLQSICGKPLNKREEWPRLTLEELLTLSPYPKADSLSSIARDELLEKCLSFIKDNHANLIRSMKRNYAMGGTFASAAIAVVSNVENQLEEVFQCSIKYTDMEICLILELVRLVDPHDFIFVVAKRLTKPCISYEFNFNLVPNLPTVISRLGPIALPTILKVALKGLWGRDYSHRLADS